MWLSLVGHGRYYDEPGEHHEGDHGPFRWHAGPALGVAILMPPTVTVAIPDDGLLTARGTETTRSGCSWPMPLCAGTAPEPARDPLVHRPSPPATRFTIMHSTLTRSAKCCRRFKPTQVAGSLVPRLQALQHSTGAVPRPILDVRIARVRMREACGWCELGRDRDHGGRLAAVR